MERVHSYNPGACMGHKMSNEQELELQPTEQKPVQVKTTVAW